MYIALYVTVLVYHFPLVSREPEDLKPFAPINLRKHTQTMTGIAAVPSESTLPQETCAQTVPACES